MIENCHPSLEIEPNDQNPGKAKAGNKNGLSSSHKMIVYARKERKKWSISSEDASQNL